MGNPAKPTLTDVQKREVCGILAVGCDRQAAARYVSRTWAEVRAAMLEDQHFASEVRRAEASAELAHMRNVQNAARDEKHWRASVWWLERRAPERYGRRETGAISPSQFQCVVDLLADIVSEEVHDFQDRERLLDRLRQVSNSLQEKLCEGNLPESQMHGEEATQVDSSSCEEFSSDEESES